VSDGALALQIFCIVAALAVALMILIPKG